MITSEEGSKPERLPYLEDIFQFCRAEFLLKKLVFNYGLERAFHT
jgi:hypothetical protein